MMTLTDLRNRLNHHPPKGDQEARYQVLRQATLQMGRQVLALTPPSPEQTEAISFLELALMKANAAIARNEAWTKTDAWKLVDASPGCAIHAAALDRAGGDRDQTHQEAELRKRVADMQARDGSLQEPEGPMNAAMGAGRMALGDSEPADSDSRFAGQPLPSRGGGSPITTRYS
ncbi:MAG: DUF7681 family protein [Vicinamibacterales bacterium]